MTSSLKEIAQQIWTITEKELVHCFRDAHVIVYSIVLPIVFYPLIVIGASEFALWREGLTEKSPIKVCVAKDSIGLLPEFVQTIKKWKKVKLVESNNPQEELKEKEIESYLVLKPDKSGILAYLNPSSDRYLETKMFIESAIDSSKSKATKEKLKKLNLPKNIFDIYSVKFESLAEIEEVKTDTKSPHKYALIKVIAIGVLCVYTLIIIQSGTVYPALTTFTLEIEKKTKLTTQLIPIQPWITVVGKFLCVVLVSLTTAIINMASLIIVILYFLFKVPHTPEIVKTVVEHINFIDFIAVFAVFIQSVILLSSAYCLVAAIAKSFKEAQNISSFILVSTMLLPAVAIIPGISLNIGTVFIPLSNLVLACKGIVSDEYSVPLVILAGALNLIMSLVLLYFSKVFFLDVKPASSSHGKLSTNEELLSK